MFDTGLAQQVSDTAAALRRAPLTGRDRDLVMFAALALDDVSRVLVELTASAHRPTRTADLDHED